MRKQLMAMLFKKDELRFLWPFYLYQLIIGLSFMISSFMVIYYVNLGFSYFQISVIMASYGFTMFLFEIPTGAFADGFSRRYSVIVGSFFYAAMVVLIPFVHNFYLVTALWSMAGIGMTFISGAEESWVISNLNHAGREDLHQEFFIKNNTFNPLGAIFAPIFGAMLVQSFSIRILWYVLGAGFFSGGLVLAFFTEEHFGGRNPELRPLALISDSYRNSREGIRFSVKHETILFLILGGLFMQMMFFANIGIAPFLVSLGMKDYQLGYLTSAVSVVGICMSFLSRRFASHKPRHVMTVVVSLLMLLYLSIIFVSPGYLFVAVLLLIVIEGLMTFGTPITQAYFHKFIPEHIRSTVVSSKSMADQFVIGLSTLAAGYLIDQFGIQRVIAFGGLFGLLAIFFYQKIRD